MMADVGCDTGTIAAVLGHADEKNVEPLFQRS